MSVARSDNVLGFGEELNLSDHMFPEFATNYIMPDEEIDFALNTFAFLQDDGPESPFPRSEVGAGPLDVPNHSAGDSFSL